MDYSFFVRKATSQDGRNIFKKYEGSLDAVPETLKPFYRDHNPVDVEIDTNGATIHFYPVEELTSLQSDYSYLNAQLVFATCNGDPIFINEESVYTCPHGVVSPAWEKLSDSIEQYFLSLIQ